MPDQVVTIHTEGGVITKRLRDMGDGTFAEVAAPPSLVLAWTDGSLVPASGNVVSGWLNLTNADVLRIGRAHSGAGTYAFEIDWSRDGSAVDFTEVVTVANNTTIEKPVAAAFARLRVRNTDAVAAFTTHRTTVYQR